MNSYTSATWLLRAQRRGVQLAEDGLLGLVVSSTNAESMAPASGREDIFVACESPDKESIQVDSPFHSLTTACQIMK